MAREDLSCPALVKKFFAQLNEKKNSLNSMKPKLTPTNVHTTKNNLALVQSTKKRIRNEFFEDEDVDDSTNSKEIKKSKSDKEFKTKLDQFLSQFNGSWLAFRVENGKYELQYRKNDEIESPNNHKRQPSKASQEKLKRFQQKLYKICSEKGLKPILLENNVDDAYISDKFQFILECKWSQDINVDKDVVVGCDCTPLCNQKTECCPGGMSAEFAYRKGKLNIEQGKPIFECNKLCKCDENCQNRVVQRGRQYKVSKKRNKTRFLNLKHHFYSFLNLKHHFYSFVYFAPITIAVGGLKLWKQSKKIRS